MDSDLRDKLAGKFIVFDGPDGCGKSTQLYLLAETLRTAGASAVCTRDPGGTEIGDHIREILMSDLLHQMEVRCETLLFMASRAQLVSEVVSPALSFGKTVLCDRFISSTCAYQGARGYDVKQVIALGKQVVGEMWPDITCILDLPAEIGLERVRERAQRADNCALSEQKSEPPIRSPIAPSDAMESRPLDFHRRARDLFRELPGLYPKPVVIVDANGPPSEVHKGVTEALRHADF